MGSSWPSVAVPAHAARAGGAPPVAARPVPPEAGRKVAGTPPAHRAPKLPDEGAPQRSPPHAQRQVQGDVQPAHRGQVPLQPHGTTAPQAPVPPSLAPTYSALEALPPELFDAVLDAGADDVADLLQLRLVSRHTGARLERYVARRHAGALASRLATTLIAEPYHHHHVYRASDGVRSRGHTWRPRFRDERNALFSPGAFWARVATATHGLHLPRTSPDFLPSLALFAAAFPHVRHLHVRFVKDHTHPSRTLHALRRDGVAGFWPQLQSVHADGSPTLARRLLGICRGSDAELASSVAVAQRGDGEGRYGLRTQAFLALLESDELVFICDVLAPSPFASAPQASAVVEAGERVEQNFWDLLHLLEQQKRRSRLRRLVYRVRTVDRHAHGLSAVFETLVRAISLERAKGGGWRFEKLQWASENLSVHVTSSVRTMLRPARHHVDAAQHGPKGGAKNSPPHALPPGLYVQSPGEEPRPGSLFTAGPRWSEGVAVVHHHIDGEGRGAL